jgi:hypothetical protein
MQKSKNHNWNHDCYNICNNMQYCSFPFRRRDYCYDFYSPVTVDGISRRKRQQKGKNSFL